MGDHLRHLINGPLKDQPDIVEMVNSGGTKGLVRGDLVISLLTEKIREEMSKGKSAFLVDGCPRNLEQTRHSRRL
jgi:adenylate kinase family enzyme